MFDEFLRNCPMEDEIKPSKSRVKNNIDSVKSLIEKEENSMTKRKLRFKPLIIAAIVVAVSALSLVTVNAAMKGAVVKFLMGGEEIEGEYYDYVDEDGYRHVSFGADLPFYEEKYAIIYDVDAPQGENVRVITEDTDPEFMEKIRLYAEARRKESGPLNHEDFGLVFKDSELCTYNYGFITETQTRSMGGGFGGEFMHTGAAYGKPSGFEEVFSTYDYENETKTYKRAFYYYVGKE